MWATALGHGLVVQHARVDRWKNGIQSFQLDACLGGRALPGNATRGGVALAFPGGDGGDERGTVRPPAVEAWAAEEVQFRLRPVQPTPVFGRVMDLQWLDQTTGCLRGE